MTTNHEQAFFEHTKAVSAPTQFLQHRKQIVRQFERFHGLCQQLHLEDAHQDARSVVMPLLLQKRDELFGEQLAAFALVPQKCTDERQSRHMCLLLEGRQSMFTFYHLQQSRCMKWSELLVRPAVLSVRSAANFWRHLVELVRLQCRLSHDFDKDTRIQSRTCPVFWADVDEAYFVCRSSTVEEGRWVLCAEQPKLALKCLSMPDEKNVACYWVVDFHCDQHDVVDYANVWFHGPRRMWGQGYYNKFIGGQSVYTVLTLVGCIELADFQVRSGDTPLMCFFSS